MVIEVVLPLVLALAPPSSAAEPERVLWEEATAVHRTGADAAAGVYRAYLARYPDGPHAPHAHEGLAMLLAEGHPAEADAHERTCEALDPHGPIGDQCGFHRIERLRRAGGDAVPAMEQYLVQRPESPFAADFRLDLARRVRATDPARAEALLRAQVATHQALNVAVPALVELLAERCDTAALEAMVSTWSDGPNDWIAVEASIALARLSQATRGSGPP